MPVQHERTPDYWLGNLAMTVTLAANDPSPKPMLKSALKEFLADHPPGSPLGDLLRTTLKERP